MWPWKRKSERPKIPVFRDGPPQRIEVKVAPPVDPGIVVEETDTSAMSRTGIFRD